MEATPLWTHAHLQTLHPSTPPAPLFSDWAAVAQAVQQVTYWSEGWSFDSWLQDKLCKVLWRLRRVEKCYIRTSPFPMTFMNRTPKYLNSSIQSSNLFFIQSEHTSLFWLSSGDLDSEVLSLIPAASHLATNCPEVWTRCHCMMRPRDHIFCKKQSDPDAKKVETICLQILFIKAVKELVTNSRAWKCKPSSHYSCTGTEWSFT